MYQPTTASNKSEQYKKSEIKGQINTQSNVDREKVKSGSIKEIALDSDCFRLMKNQAISIRDLI
jgi:hypothetical protein